MKDSPSHSCAVTVSENGVDNSKTPCRNDKENVEVSPKINAFQFMMNSRHKTIGRNSPGREIDLNQSTNSALTKKELKSRKSQLESWAEQKGASKRKREYEEVGNMIDHKLQLRERRMKKLLRVEECQSDDEVITRKKKKMKSAVIESDNEAIFEEECEKAKKKKISRSRNSNKGEPTLTVKSNKTWKFKIKLSMHNDSDKEDCISKDSSETNTESEISVEDTFQTENETNVDDSVILITEESEVVENKRSLRNRRSKPKTYEDYELSDEDEDRTNIKNKQKDGKKKIKVAPVFINALPKPKIDPSIAEARRQFLMSGIPSSLKKEMEKQPSAEDINFDVFPTISHVQQKSPENSFWKLPKVNLTLQMSDDANIETKNVANIIDVTTTPSTEERVLPTKLSHCKRIIKKIKSQNLDYPVYKIFNSFCRQRPQKIEEKLKPKRRGRPKKNPDKIIETALPNKFDENSLHVLWIEKYKPKSSSDIIGNHNAVSSLKQWLTNRLNMSRNLKKRKDDSESDFDVDSDSCDSSKMSGNTVVVKGPVGSGKTAAIYAVCDDLGLSVIEVNASSKRTGKRLLQELQEATQSHQVRKKGNALSSLFNKTEEKSPNLKMCALLIEDVDIVFDQDEGFTSALSQIIATSKRPIILTMTDEAGSNVQKSINDCEVINFAPLSSILTVWLQIVCLVEGYYVKSESIQELLSYFKGDIRRTLLQLQVYVNSGGHLCKNNFQGTVADKVEIDNKLKIEDDNSNLSDLKDDCSDDHIETHGNCLQVGNIVGDFYDLGVIWWNLPRLLNLPNFSSVRLERNKKFEIDDYEEANKTKIKMLFHCYENLALADVCGQGQYHESLERRCRPKLKDSICLEEDLTSYNDDFSSILTQNLVNLTIKKCSGHELGLNMAVPVTAEQRWRSKQLSTDEKLKECVSLSAYLDRKSLALDYMPYLRNIARNDCKRALTNTKRSNRYYNHLKNLNVRCSEATYRTACDVFKIWD